MKKIHWFLVFLGEILILILATAVLIAIVFWAITPRPIVQVGYRGYDNVRAQDVVAVLVWDSKTENYVLVANPDDWFAKHHDGRYTVEYCDPKYHPKLATKP